MAYTDYEFYTGRYFGNIIPEADFSRLSERASEKIDGLTNKRLRKWMPEDEGDAADVQKAVCALAESLYYSETLASAGMASIGGSTQSDGTIRGKVVSSISSGSESMSFATGGTSASSLEGGEIQRMQESKRQEAKGFLSGIQYKNYGYNLLFSGVGFE